MPPPRYLRRYLAVGNPVIEEPDSYVKKLIDRLRTSPRKRQSNLEYIQHVWFPNPYRTRQQRPAHISVEAISTIADCLTDHRRHVRLAAIVALRRPDPHFEIAATSVIAALNDDFVDVRVNACNALASYRDHRHLATKRLQLCLSSSHKRLMRFAARVLATTAPEQLQWDILNDAALTDPSSFDQWISGLGSLVRAGIAATSDLLAIRNHVVVHHELFLPHAPLMPQKHADLWIDELVRLPDFTFESLKSARTQFNSRVEALQAGNVYCNLLDEVLAECENAR